MANRCLRLIRNRNRSTTRKISARVGNWARVPIKRDRRRRLSSMVVSLKRNCHTSPPRKRFLLVKPPKLISGSRTHNALLSSFPSSASADDEKVYSRGPLPGALRVSRTRRLLQNAAVSVLQNGVLDRIEAVAQWFGEKSLSRIIF